MKKPPRRALYVGGLLVLFLLAACAGTSPKVPGFTIELTPKELSAGPGETVEFKVKVTPEPGFEGELTLTLVDAPPGFSLYPNSLTIGNGPVTETFELTLPDTSEPLDLTLKIAFSASNLEKTATLHVIITLPEVKWVQRDSGTDARFNNVVFLGDRFYALGNGGTVRISEDGVNWSALDVNTTCHLYDLTRGPAGWVMVGAYSTNRCTLFSPDGLSWSPVVTNNEGLAVAYGDGTYMAAVPSRATVSTSGDGQDWTYVHVGPPGATDQYSYMLDVLYIQNKFIVLDQVGGIYVTNGQVETADDWQLARAPDHTPLQAITHGSGTFVVVGLGGAILTAPGVFDTWQVVVETTEGPDGEKLNLYDVVFGNGTFVAVGRRCRILTSPSPADAASWVQDECPTQYIPDLYGVAYGKGRFVLVGQHGAIFSSP